MRRAIVMRAPGFEMRCSSLTSAMTSGHMLDHVAADDLVEFVIRKRIGNAPRSWTTSACARIGIDADGARDLFQPQPTSRIFLLRLLPPCSKFVLRNDATCSKSKA